MHLTVYMTLATMYIKNRRNSSGFEVWGQGQTLYLTETILLRIGLITSAIQNRLIDLKRQQDLTIKHAEYIENWKNEVIQNIAPLLGSTTLPKTLENPTELSDFFSIDKNLREIILIYEGVRRWKDLSERETISRLEDMQKEIDIIMELINNELKK